MQSLQNSLDMYRCSEESCAANQPVMCFAGKEYNQLQELNVVSAAIAATIKTHQKGFDETALGQVIRLGHLSAALEVRAALA